MAYLLQASVISWIDKVYPGLNPIYGYASKKLTRDIKIHYRVLVERQFVPAAALGLAPPLDATVDVHAARLVKNDVGDFRLARAPVDLQVHVAHHEVGGGRG